MHINRNVYNINYDCEAISGWTFEILSDMKTSVQELLTNAENNLALVVFNHSSCQSYNKIKGIMPQKCVKINRIEILNIILTLYKTIYFIYYLYFPFKQSYILFTQNLNAMKQILNIF